MLKQYIKELNQINQCLHNFYFLVGDDIFLLQYFQCKLTNIAKQKQYKTISFFIDKKTLWSNIFKIMQETNLFANKQVLSLYFISDNLDFKHYNDNLLKISKLLNNKLIIIIIFKLINYLDINSISFNKITKNIKTVICNKPNRKSDILKLMNIIIKEKKILLDEKAINLIYYSYKSNFLFLSKFLEFIKQIWPKKKIVFDNIKNIYFLSAKITNYQFIQYIINRNIKKSLTTLKYIEYDYKNLFSIIRLLKKEITLLTIMNKMIHTHSLEYILKKLKISLLHGKILRKSLIYFNLEQILHVIKIINYIIINFIKLDKKTIFLYLEEIIYILYNKNFLLFYKKNINKLNK